MLTSDSTDRLLGDCQGILIPGGFGGPGHPEGKILAAAYARTHGIPYLGIALGCKSQSLNLRAVSAGLTDANSGEFDEATPNKVIDFMPDQYSTMDKGGTMRLGIYPCRIAPGTHMHECYKTDFYIRTSQASV